MADYSKEEIKRIEEKWRNEWQQRGIYKVENQSNKPKYYVLDMFPYPFWSRTSRRPSAGLYRL